MNEKIIKNNRTGIYIHIPFCLSKCDYCDFASFAGVKNKADYISALISDIKSKALRHEIGVVDTIYLGGGTPSILDSESTRSILECVKDSFSVADDAEITIEINPATVCEDKILEYKKFGINRASVGIQSFENAELAAVCRAHTGEDAAEVLQMVARHFDNFSCDLMLGLPLSTMKSVFSNVKKALSFSPTHISLYGLQVEEGTRLFEKVENGLILPREDIVADMFELCENMLSDGGFSHYEISNFAAAGFESRHNIGYWKLKDYLGIGASAHSLVGQNRFFAPADLDEYIASVKSGDCEIFEETLTIEDAKKEFAMLGLRLKDGVNLAEYRNMFGSKFEYDFKGAIEKFAAYLEIDAEKICIPEKYFYVSNQIISEFM